MYFTLLADLAKTRSTPPSTYALVMRRPDTDIACGALLAAVGTTRGATVPPGQLRTFADAPGAACSFVACDMACPDSTCGGTAVHAPTTSLASTGPVGDKASVAAEEQSAAREREGLL